MLVVYSCELRGGRISHTASQPTRLPACKSLLHGRAGAYDAEHYTASLENARHPCLTSITTTGESSRRRTRGNSLQSHVSQQQNYICSEIYLYYAIFSITCVLRTSYGMEPGLYVSRARCNILDCTLFNSMAGINITRMEGKAQRVAARALSPTGDN